LFLKNQFVQLQNKFRQFQKPSDFEPKYARARQILQEVEHHLHSLEIRSDEPEIVHNQLDLCNVRFHFETFIIHIHVILFRNSIKLFRILNLKLNMLFVLAEVLSKKDKLKVHMN